METQYGVPLTAGVIRIKLNNTITFEAPNTEKIPLAEGAYLTIEEDGKLRFHNAGFEGYAVITYLSWFVVYDSNGKPLVAVKDGAKPNYQNGLSSEEKTAAEKAAQLLCTCQ